MRAMLHRTLWGGCMPILLFCAAGCVTGFGPPSGGAEKRESDPMPAAPAEWVSEVKLEPGFERPGPLREADIARSLTLLGSKDFGDRTRGSRSLLAYGEQAVPYLGHRVGITGLPPDPHCAACIVVRSIIGKLPPQRIGVHLESPYAIVRIAAAEIAGERRMFSLAPVLVALLDDDEVSVRRASVTALRRIARAFVGYRAGDSPAKRAKSIAAWKRVVAALSQ